MTSGLDYPRHVRVATVGAVVVISCALALWQLWDTFYYAYDDLPQFQVARQFGLSRELLTLNVFGHFGPVDRLGHLLLLDFRLNPAVGAAMAAGLIGALLLIIAALTYELGLSLIRRLLILAAAGGSMSFLDNARWADSTLHIFPALIVSYAVITLHVRGIRTNQRRWHILSVLLFPLGLLTQERAAFALPMIVLFDLFLVWNDTGIRQRLRNLWSVRWPLLAMAVMGAVAAYFIARNYGSNTAGPDLGTVARTALMALTSFQFPQLVGVEPLSTPTTAWQLVLLGLIGIVCTALVAVNRRNAGPVGLLFCTFALFWGFLVFSPILDSSLIQPTAGRLANAVYVTVPALIAVGSLRGPAAMSSTVASWSRARPTRTLALGFVGAMLVTSYLAVMVSAVAVRDWWPGRDANTFYRNAAAGIPQWTDPAVTVVPLRGPPGVGGDWSEDFAQHQFLLPLIEPGWALGDLTARPVVLTFAGTVAPVTLESVAAGSQAGACNTPPTGSGDGVQLPTTPRIAGGPLFARISYRSDSAGSIRAVAFDGSSYRTSPWPQPVTPGAHTTIVPLPAGAVDAVRIFGLPDGSTFCIDALDIVRPLREIAGEGCATIDVYAIPTAWVDCPSQS